MEYPKIYLALDNCFALKRWVEPETWLPLIKDLGYTSIQASYDNEFDMLYNTKEYIDSWLERLTVAEKQYGAKVQSFYSGYQTYRTSGLAHPDRRVVNSIVEGWIKPAVKIAGERNADMGFALHGIPENIMQDPEKYRECHEKLYRIYSDIGEYARKNGQVHVCVEAMYSPHHTPWTIEGTKEFLKNIYSLDGNAIYTTVDIGHMTGVTLYFSVPAITVICIIIGIIIGIVNGALIAKCKLAPFIVTLGTMYIGRGLANIRSGGNTFSSIKGQEALGNVGIMQFDSRVFAVGGFPGIPIAAILFLILAVIAAFVLKKTPFGWHILAIGGNEKAARLSGIKVEKNIILVYAISGACSALIGLVTMAQIAASHPNTGDTWEMNAIAAVVLGGTSMAGGVGTIGGTVIGAFVIGIINDGMTMCGVSEFWQKVIKGLVIILAVLIDQFQRNLQAKMALQARNENK